MMKVQSAVDRVLRGCAGGPRVQFAELTPARAPRDSQGEAMVSVSLHWSSSGLQVGLHWGCSGEVDWLVLGASRSLLSALDTEAASARLVTSSGAPWRSRRRKNRRPLPARGECRPRLLLVVRSPADGQRLRLTPRPPRATLATQTTRPGPHEQSGNREPFLEASA